jgi:hypothetical protein
MSILQDIRIGLGDNRPWPVWHLNIDISSSDFELAVVNPGRSRILLRASRDELIVDVGAGTITWPITAQQSAGMPVGSHYYTLRRISPEIRFYASGSVIVTNGPVDPSLVDVIVAGPQGPPGEPADPNISTFIYALLFGG